MRALLLGSISVLSDTSELQRAAFNQAFHDAGLDWYWPLEEYRRMLGQAGGQDRIEACAKKRGVRVDARRLHKHKTEIFQAALREGQHRLRPLTEMAIADARANGLKVAVVSTTARASLDALISSLGGAEQLGLDFVISGDDGVAPKPSPQCYAAALQRLEIEPRDAVAIEDNRDGTAAARAARVPCYIYPNENTVGHDFGPFPHLRELAMREAA